MRTSTILFCALVCACGGSHANGGPAAAPTKDAVVSPPASTKPHACPAFSATPFHIVTQEGAPSMAEMQASRDGKILAMRGSAREIQLWSVASGNKVAIVANKTPVVKWSLRPDGHAIAFIADGKVSLKDLDHGGVDKPGLGAPLALAGGDVEQIDWTADGSTLFVVRGNETDLVDAKTGAVRSTLGAVATVNGISPDGRWLLSREGQLWDVRANKQRWKAPALPSSAAFSDNGEVLAIASGDRLINVVDAATGAKRWNASTTGAREGEIGISPDGRAVSTYDSGEYKYARGDQVDQGIALWVKGKRVRIAKANEAAPTRASFSPDGKWIAYVGGSRYSTWGYEIVVADATTGVRAKNGAVNEQVRMEPPRWASDSRTVLQSGVSGMIVFETGPHGARKLIGKPPPNIVPIAQSWVHDAVWSPDDASLLVLTEGGDGHGYRAAASIVDLKNGTIVRSIDAKLGSKSAYARRFRTAEWSGEGGFLALTRGDGVVVWDGHSPEPSRLLDSAGAENEDRMVSIAAKGNLVATATGQQKDVRLIDPKTGAIVRTITLEESNVESMSFSVDGTRLAIATLVSSSTGEQSAQVLLYDPATGAQVRALHAQARQVYFGRPYSALHWAPQGKAIVTVDSQGGVDLWNTTNDDAPQPLFDRTTPGPSAMADGGNFLFTGSPILELWDLRSRAKVRELPGDGSTIEHVRVTKSGAVAAVARGDHVDLYRLSDGAHLTLRTPPGGGVVVNADNGNYAGPKDSLSSLRVRDGEALEVRPLHPNELAALSRPSLALDFVSGCPLEAAP